MAAHQAPLSLGFSRQEHWSGLPFPSPMTNLDSILKSRDVTLLTKVRLVKAMVFPVVTYGCESWTIRKVEHQRTDAFELWCWRRILKVPWTATRWLNWVTKIDISKLKGEENLKSGLSTTYTLLLHSHFKDFFFNVKKRCRNCVLFVRRTIP